MEGIGEPLVRYGVVTGGEEERRWERVVRRLERAWLGRVDRMRVRAVRVCRAVAAEVQSAQLRAQLTQWVLEWLVIVGEAEQRDVGEWPPDDRLRARQLLVCMNAGFTPPWEAWGWLAGASKVLGGRKPPGAGSAAWEGVWREFCALARDECAGAELGVLREQPLCWLAGTPLAEIRRGILVNWNHAAVRAYFRAAWERARTVSYTHLTLPTS
ncbi:MAG: hypothetical protein N2595_01735, partial [bacterium]|nr:hypothetical protein [bacterium]